MKISQLKAISAKFKASNRLPILDNFLIKDDTGYITDLSSSIVIHNLGVNPGLEVCVNRKELLSIFESLPDAEISASDEHKVIFTRGDDIATLSGDDPKDFPGITDPKQNFFDYTGDIDPVLFNQLEQALKFISKDELRPSMCNVYVFDKICATDAHRLYFENINEPFQKQVLISPKTIQLLKICGAEKTFFRVAHNDKYLKFSSADFTIFQRVIDERYPDFMQVIPTDNQIVCNFDTKTMVDKLKLSLKFANLTTHQVTLTFNGKIGISAEDIDFSREYKSSMNYIDMLGEIVIGFNANFLLDILANCSGTTKIEMSSPKRGAIIDNKFLLMPTMIN